MAKETVVSGVNAQRGENQNEGGAFGPRPDVTIKPLNARGTPRRYIVLAFALLLGLAAIFIIISCWLLWYPH